MGNRAVLTFTKCAPAPAIYLHWNGGRASVDGFLRAARELGLGAKCKTDGARMDQLASMIAAALETRVGFTVYREPYGRTDRDNGDNGVYLLSRDWHIVGRLYAPRIEEIDEAKTADIAESCVVAVADAHYINERA